MNSAQFSVERRKARNDAAILGNVGLGLDRAARLHGVRLVRKHAKLDLDVAMTERDGEPTRECPFCGREPSIKNGLVDCDSCGVLDVPFATWQNRPKRFVSGPQIMEYYGATEKEHKDG